MWEYLRRKSKAVIICVPILLILLGGCTGVSDSVQEPPYMELTTEDSLFEGRFYYEQLSEEEQLVYKEIYQGIIEEREEICLHSGDTTTVSNILPSVFYDFPELFWTEGNGTVVSHDSTYTVLKLKYNYVGEERSAKEAKMEEAVSEILASVPKEYGEYEKIKYIYEYLIGSIAYVEDAPDNQNIYSALVRKESVCAGYAKANQYLLGRLGIYCTYVIGTAKGEEEWDGHAWNLVRCDGKYYYVDVTWADSMFSEDSFSLDEMIYDYLCCDEKKLSATHEKDSNYTYPECNSDDLDYYRLNHMLYEKADRTRLQNAMYRSVDAKESGIMFQFSDFEVYSQAKEILTGGLLSRAVEYLGRRYDIEEVQCYYKDYDDLNKFVIYWQYE